MGTETIWSQRFFCNRSDFWLIWFINQRALYSHALSIVVGVIGIIIIIFAPPPGTGLDIKTSYLVHTCTYTPPPYMHIRYLVILICSFLMAAILVLFFDLLSCPYRQPLRLHIAYTCTYLSLLYLDTQKE